MNWFLSPRTNRQSWNSLAMIEIRFFKLRNFRGFFLTNFPDWTSTDQAVHNFLNFWFCDQKFVNVWLDRNLEWRFKYKFLLRFSNSQTMPNIGDKYQENYRKDLSQYSRNLSSIYRYYQIKKMLHGLRHHQRLDLFVE